MPPEPRARQPKPGLSSLPIPNSIQRIPRISVLDILSDRPHTLVLRVNWGAEGRRILKVVSSTKLVRVEFSLTFLQFTKSQPSFLTDPLISETVAYGMLSSAQTPSVPHCYGWIKPRKISKFLPHVDLERYAPVFLEALTENENRCAAVLIEEVPGLPATAETLTPPLLDQALQALAGIHAAGVLHCDTVPRNLLVSHDGKSVWWIDFDFSRNSIQWEIDDAEWGLEMTLAENQLKEI